MNIEGTMMTLAFEKNENDLFNVQLTLSREEALLKSVLLMEGWGWNLRGTRAGLQKH